MGKDERIIKLLEEILIWMKYDYHATKEKMLEILDTDDKKIVYELSDGERSRRDLTKYVSVSGKTISNWWNDWFDSGLVVQTEKYEGGRYKRLCSLTKMGIRIPMFERHEDE